MAKKKSVNVEVMIEEARLAFESIYEPDTNGDKPRYKAMLILDPETKVGKRNIKNMQNAIADCIAQMWPDDPPRFKEEKLPLREGNNLTKVYDGFEDMWFVSAAAPESDRPQVVDRRRRPVRRGEAQAPYSGCYVNAIVRVWPQDSEKYGRRINCALDAIQFHSDGEAFSGRKPVDVNKFKNYDDEEDEDERPSRPTKRRDDDDDDERPTRPSKKRRDFDDDEDERPTRAAKKRRNDDDEDEIPF